MNSFFKFLLTLCIFAIGFFVVSCGGGGDDPAPSPEPDKEKPTVSFVKPKADEEYFKSFPLDIDATFADNVGLAECKIIITYNQVTPSAGLKGINDPWKKASNGSEPGEHVVTFDGEKTKKVEIPQLFGENIEDLCKGGSYTLTFTFTDKSGNEAIEKVNVSIQ